MEDKEVTGSSPAPSVDEKLLTQSQVNELVGREKARASERTRLELEARYKDELEKVRQQAPQAQEPEIDMSDIENRMSELVEHTLQKRQEEAEKRAFEQSVKSQVDKYHLKMGKGSTVFEDYNDVMGEFKPDAFANTVLLAAELDNTPEVMYELTKNPSKLLEIDLLAQRSPDLAMKQLKKLSESIAQNLEAKESNVTAPAPLSRLKSSSVGADTGKMTLKDLKAAPWLKA